MITIGPCFGSFDLLVACHVSRPLQCIVIGPPGLLNTRPLIHLLIRSGEHWPTLSLCHLWVREPIWVCGLISADMWGKKVCVYAPVLGLEASRISLLLLLLELAVGGFIPCLRSPTYSGGIISVHRFLFWLNIPWQQIIWTAWVHNGRKVAHWLSTNHVFIYYA